MLILDYHRISVTLDHGPSKTNHRKAKETVLGFTVPSSKCYSLCFNNLSSATRTRIKLPFQFAAFKLPV
ncbi:unnamed protein product [Lathyrus sativus]|nr:unnamed protein product [Lathyrus sativus]